jgi:DNA mismatch endonuclease Vsr
MAIQAVMGHERRIDRNVTTMAGRPDVVIPSLRLVIFADGCFFHACCPSAGRTSGRESDPSDSKQAVAGASHYLAARSLTPSAGRGDDTK